MKKSVLLLGSSLLGMALLAASAAVAADDVVVEGGAAPAAAGEPAAAATGDLPRGFYAVGAVGLSMWEPDKTSTLWATDFTVDDVGSGDDFLWSLGGGYRMNDWLGFEVAWTDIGGFKATDQINATDYNKTDLYVDGLETRLKFWHNLWMDRIGLPSSLTAIGGLGAYFYSSHTDSSCYVGGNKVTCPFGRLKPVNGKNDSGESFTASVGLQYQITDNVLVRTEYQRFFAVDKTNVDTLTASVVFGFYDLFGQGKPSSGDDMGGIVVE